MERAAVEITFAATRGEEFGFGFFGLSEGLVVRDRDVGVEVGIELVDASEDEFGEFDGRERAFAEEAGDLFDAGEREFGVGGWGHSEFARRNKNLTQTARRTQRGEEESVLTIRSSKMGRSMLRPYKNEEAGIRRFCLGGGDCRRSLCWRR